MKKPKFLANFWAAFKEVLGRGHQIRGLDGCDFSPIYQHLMAEREAKKKLSKEVRPQILICALAHYTGRQIRGLDGCGFSPSYQHLMADWEAKKKLSKVVRPWTAVPELLWPIDGSGCLLGKEHPMTERKLQRMLSGNVCLSAHAVTLDGAAG